MLSLTPQGAGEPPKCLSGRLLAAVWWLFCFLFVITYTSNLAAFLTVSKIEAPVQSFDDLINQFNIQYAPVVNSDASDYFERMANVEERFYEAWKDTVLDKHLPMDQRKIVANWEYPVKNVYSKVWQTILKTGQPKTLEEGVALVRASPSMSEGFALITDEMVGKYLELTNCDLQVVGDAFSGTPFSLALQQGSPLKDKINEIILELFEDRSIDKFDNDWWNKNPKKLDCGAEVVITTGIAFENIAGLFVCILGGFFLAMITLFVEYMYYKDKGSKTNKVHDFETKKKIIAK